MTDIMRNCRFIFFFLFVLMTSLTSLTSCREEVDNILTIQQDKMAEYFNKNPEEFSSFYTMAEKAGMIGVLNSYGNYTCFAPNNAAVDSFISQSEFKTINNFPADSLRKLVLYQLIEEDRILTIDFTSGRLRSSNMAGDNLQVSYLAGDSMMEIKVNGKVRILKRDIKLKNGVVHETNGLIMPSPDNVFTRLKSGVESDSSRYSIFYEALKQTGIYYLLSPISDNHVFTYNNGTTSTDIPRKFKFTVFVECDSLYMERKDIKNFEELEAYYDPEGSPMHGNITNPENKLYQFVAYHCLDRIYDSNNFHTFTAMQPKGALIIPTMCPNTLIEYREFASPIGGMINRFTDEDEVPLTAGFALHPKNRDIMANNGMIHEITEIMEIPDQNTVFHKKMRFNIGGLMPELINNDFKGKAARMFPDPGVSGPQYFKNMKVIGLTGNAAIGYDYNGIWIRHQWDEIGIGTGEWTTVRSDVYLTTPPIPEGTWEIRLGYTNNQFRGMFQFYFDGEPCGVPVNMYMFQDYGVAGMDDENAKKTLRNNGSMIYPPNIVDRFGNFTSATAPQRFRKIITVKSFDSMKTHIVRFKSVSAGFLSLNFFEVIPFEQISYEEDN